ncbi:MAG: bifunctional UDP-N-acetylglucosamine diphosphorylase/glucosamine-1-phosphate N-acetyltransferase GlmU [Pyrinomonadaceae bacterium]
MNVLIMAAGLGTRMRSNRAKVLHELDGRPLINHVLETALALALEKVFVVVGHQDAQVKAGVLSEFDSSFVTFVRQEKQLGTGDAVNSCRRFLEKDSSALLILSGDVPMITSQTLTELTKLHEEFRGGGAACTILSVRLENPTGYGRIIRGDNGLFKRVVEQKDASDDDKQVDEINSGIYCFNSKKLFAALSQVNKDNAQGEFYLTDVPGILSQQNDDVAIFQCSDPAEVEGVNDRRQLADMEENFRQRTRTRLMLKDGVTLVDPPSTYVSRRSTLGRDTVLYPNVTIEGKSVIGDGCVLRSGTRIVDSIIGNAVEIRDNCLIVDSSIGDDCTVGPMAHLRGKASMIAGSKVGNFVELKKTTLGAGSKASHLTYLGDAIIGENTNIGAGTVTCNYDGTNKHETRIGSGVKIGSDTMLVAPVTVGDGSATAAGSVVTKDVEAGTLVAGVPAAVKKRKETSPMTGETSSHQKRSPERVSGEASISRMNSFAERKEKFIAAVQKSKN